MASLALGVGQSIELNDGRHAVVRFLGATGFAPGEWVGVELQEATGKNDGSVKGDRYFDCEPNYGMFLRAAGVSRILSRPSTRTRPTSISIPPALDPAKAASALPSPTKSPTKITRTATPSTAQHTRNPTPPTAANTARRPLSTATATATAKPRTASNLTASSTPSAAARRTSTVPSSNSSATAQTPRNPASTTAPASSRLTTRTISNTRGLTPAARQSSIAAKQTPAARRTSTVPKQPQPQDSPSPKPSPSAVPADDSQNVQDADDDQDAPQSFAPSSKPATSPAASHTSARPTKTTAREVEDLQTKMKIMERKRQEDRDALKKMQNVEQERDKYANIVQKMQSKMQAQSHELNDLRSQLKDSESRLIDIEAIQAEHDAVVEMATLDREMAEETAESLKSELEVLRASNEEMRLELDILREENVELGREMNPEERTSQGWLQLERSNERLREALLRLRDMTQEQEADLKAQIASLEDEVKDFGLLKTNYEETREKLLATEADLDDIRQQLDAAMGAEDMIEELTERNMAMQEKIDDLELVIEDLENLKELNDELEINHVEAEKQMQEEIDFKDNVIGEQSRRSAQQQQAIEDCEYTISRFRELVTNLQADLEDMRASRQITETEAEELSSRSRAMMDLNMKLQMSAAKTQIKTIDLELRRLEAEEAAEHLAIVQLFLPDAFNAERDSILALLRFKRVGFKSRLLNSLVKERLKGQGTNIANEDIFAAYSVLDRLTWIAEMSDRFINGIRSCSVEEFARYESALYELEPVERALNTYIDAIKRDDMKEGRVDEELQRSMAVMSHLASIHIKDSLAASANDMLMQASLIQSHLDSTSSALGVCRSLVQGQIPVPHTEASESEEPDLFTHLDAIISSIRSARVVVNKTHRNVTDLQSRSLALGSPYLELLISAESLTSKLAVFGRRAGEKVQSLFGEEGREESVTLDETELLLTRLSASIFGSGSTETTPFATLTTYLASLTTQLQELSDISANLENTQEFERPVEPWVTRSATLRATKLTSVDTEAEVSRLTEIVRERSLLVRSKEQELEEQSVRIEMLEARMAEATKRSSALADLERSITALQKEKTQQQNALAEAEQRVTRLRKERDEWRKSAEENEPDPTATNTMASEMGGASKMELDRARLRIDSLESAIRYLQQQSAPKSATAGSADLDWLETPLVVQPSKAVQRQKTLQAEGRTAFSEMIKLVTDAKPVSLSNMPKNRLAWRPAAQTAKWHAQKKKEDWATWQDWERNLLDRVEGRNANKKIIGSVKYGHLDSVGHDVVVVGEDV